MVMRDLLEATTRRAVQYLETLDDRGVAPRLSDAVDALDPYGGGPLALRAGGSSAALASHVRDDVGVTRADRHLGAGLPGVVAHPCITLVEGLTRRR